VKLAEEGIAQVGPADKRTLLRRVTYDLTGLPPAPADLDSFEGDRSLDAFAHVVERLLASPAYGERWGRHWLDLVRYADTAGETGDYPATLAWKYRNYVIAAFNADKPYDRTQRIPRHSPRRSQQPDFSRSRGGSASIPSNTCTSPTTT
jgi:hypothetical protein